MQQKLAFSRDILNYLKKSLVRLLAVSQAFRKAQDRRNWLRLRRAPFFFLYYYPPPPYYPPYDETQFFGPFVYSVLRGAWAGSAHCATAQSTISCEK